MGIGGREAFSDNAKLNKKLSIFPDTRSIRQLPESNPVSHVAQSQHHWLSCQIQSGNIVGDLSKTLYIMHLKSYLM